MVLEDRSAEAYLEGVWALKQCAAMSGSPSWKPDASRRVVGWAAKVPKLVDIDAVLGLADKDWIYATDAIKEFMDLVGVPNIERRHDREGSPYRRSNMQ
jgi:hypothetical protein